jgi:hypothetical protein
LSSPIAAALVILSLWLLVSPLIHPLLRRAWDRHGR